jgi:hypothetical protein
MTTTLTTAAQPPTDWQRENIQCLLRKLRFDRRKLKENPRNKKLQEEVAWTQYELDKLTDEMRQ